MMTMMTLKRKWTCLTVVVVAFALLFCSACGHKAAPLPPKDDGSDLINPKTGKAYQR